MYVSVTCCDDDDDDDDEVSFMLLDVVFRTFWRVVLSLCFCWRFSRIDDMSAVEFVANASDISGIYIMWAKSELNDSAYSTRFYVITKFMSHAIFFFCYTVIR